MTKEQIYFIASELFSLSREEVDEYLDKNIKNESCRQRLEAVLTAVEPYCRKFYEESDLKLRRKAGAVVFSTVDASKYSRTESPKGTYNRLYELFRETSYKRDINIYKLLYTTVLTDANLKNDRENGVKFPDASRNFVNIYGSLKKTLLLSDRETEEIFERCTSLIAKAYSYRFSQIYGSLHDLYIVDSDNFYRVFRTTQSENEVISILKINPTLFCMSPDKIDAAFKYLRPKIYEKAKTYGNVTPLEAKLILVRQWVKNNSSLLTINAEAMKNKESFLTLEVDARTNYKYSQQLKAIFDDPVRLSAMNQIPEKKLRENALKNIQLLEEFASSEQVADYIADNMVILAVSNEKLETLLNDILSLDGGVEGGGYFQRFLSVGKTLFGSSCEINAAKILTKLKNVGNIEVVDVENLQEEDYLEKFVELFADGDKSIVENINQLIDEKKKRNLRGEKELRNNIRELGRDIKALPSVLQREDVSILKKRDVIFEYAANAEHLFAKRLKLAQVDAISQARDIEIENSAKIESALNTLREIYEQKHQKVEKHYLNADKLYEKLMIYLGRCFDDKEAISDLFSKEVSKNYIEGLTQTYQAEKSEQQTLFGQVWKVSGVHSGLVKPLEKLGRELLQDENDVVEFENQR